MKVLDIIQLLLHTQQRQAEGQERFYYSYSLYLPETLNIQKRSFFFLRYMS